MEDFWSLICVDSSCSETEGRSLCFDIKFLKDPSSCTNHLFIICFELLLLIMLSAVMIQKKFLIRSPIRVEGHSKLQLISSITNGCIGLLHLCLGIWILEEKIKRNFSIFPLSWWLLELLQGFTWMLIALTTCFLLKKLPRTWSRLFSILVFFVSSTFCAFSLSYAFRSGELSLRLVLDVLSFLGAFLLLFCTYKACTYEDTDMEIDGSLRTPLNSELNEVDRVSHVSVTQFSKAGLFSLMSFWWLNPLIRRGQEKILHDEDVPTLRESDRAEVCYSMFIDQLNRQRQKDDKSSSRSLVLRTIILCHCREILLSGFFALLKVLTLSCCPIILNAFILAAEDNESSKYESYVLAISLLFTKIIESLSQRQWYFRARLVGMKVKSLLVAAVYKKQLRLSNAAKLIHSGGEIMNYVNVDAYRIGELPFWFHHTWTTFLQLCISLVIIFRAVGLATIASLVVIVLTALLNTPLAKLQHKFLSKLLVAQDERLKASSEALVNVKVLKLYAWETQFKNAIESLRFSELKFLSSVLLQKAYNVILFWFSPFSISASSFAACYFLNVPLHANNIFTFVATIRLMQDPISTIPDVIGVIIQANIAFSRIVKFLEAPELQSSNFKKSRFDAKLKGSILIKSAEFSWECDILKPTIRNINLKVSVGQKIAICGEVGSGKSTLLAAILGEVSNTKGNVRFYLLYKHK